MSQATESWVGGSPRVPKQALQVHPVAFPSKSLEIRLLEVCKVAPPRPTLMGGGYTRGPHIPSPLFPLLKLGEGVQDESGLGRWRSPEVGDERLEVGQGSLLLGKRSLNAPPAPGEREVGKKKDDLIFFFFF